MTDQVEISKRMRVTAAHLEIKTRNGWRKVWWKKAKTIRGGVKWLGTANKIGLGLLCVAIIWAVIEKINH